MVSSKGKKGVSKMRKAIKNLLLKNKQPKQPSLLEPVELSSPDGSAKVTTEGMGMEVDSNEGKVTFEFDGSKDSSLLAEYASKDKTVSCICGVDEVSEKLQKNLEKEGFNVLPSENKNSGNFDVDLGNMSGEKRKAVKDVTFNTIQGIISSKEK
jgi:hypothetical protein